MNKKLTLTPSFQKHLESLTPLKRELTYTGLDLPDYGQAKFVAIVGSRKPSPYGKEVTRNLASQLASQGIVIVSGLAMGVDSIAHLAALDSGGRTIAVLPSGLDNIYPAVHGNIAADIVKNGGTLISEYLPDHQPRKAEFLSRNRIIAALSDIVIITEAALLSGSLNTAGHAKRAGIPVGAVPGAINNPMSQGANHLLKKGALTITSPQDVLNVLGIKSTSKKEIVEIPKGGNSSEQKIIDVLASNSLNIDELAINTKININELLVHLTMLEISGAVRQNSLGIWSI